MPRLEVPLERASARPRQRGSPMRGAMLWFNETKNVGVITAETGERLSVERDDFEGRNSPKGRCSGRAVEFRISDDAEVRRAEQVVLVRQVSPRRARRRHGQR